MKRILFPIEAVDDKTRENSMSWEGLDPLEMATRIAQLAIQKDAPQSTSTDKTKKPPIKIDAAFLASKTPDLPKVTREIESLPINTYDKTSNNRRKKWKEPKTKPRKECNKSPQQTSTRSNVSSRTRAGTKRELTECNDEDSSCKPPFESKKTIEPWDLDFVSTHNTDQFAARYATQQLLMLAGELEASDCFEDCISSYEQVRLHLQQDSETISKSDHSNNEKSQKFYSLYSSVIQQMRALIVMVEKMAEDKRKRNSDVKDGKSGKKPSKIHVGPGQFTKEGFTAYMNQWIKDNWTNPFPDEGDLQEIAQVNGTSPSVVNNWLINTRTRKWRPAINTAYHTDRPADSLKEDSINIFEGKTVTGESNVVKP